MSKKFFASAERLANKKCVACGKPNPRADNNYCELCEEKRCRICGKISIYTSTDVEIEIDMLTLTIPLCIKHYKAHLRFKYNNTARWDVDKEYLEWRSSLVSQQRRKEIAEKIAAKLITQESAEPQPVKTRNAFLKEIQDDAAESETRQDKIDAALAEARNRESEDN